MIGNVPRQPYNNLYWLPARCDISQVSLNANWYQVCEGVYILYMFDELVRHLLFSVDLPFTVLPIYSLYRQFSLFVLAHYYPGDIFHCLAKGRLLPTKTIKLDEVRGTLFIRPLIEWKQDHSHYVLCYILSLFISSKKRLFYHIEYSRERERERERDKLWLQPIVQNF